MEDRRKQYRLAAIGYAMLFGLELLANIWMASGFTFSEGYKVLAAARAEMFKYFTIDSNILMGVVACVLMVFNLQALKGKRSSVPGVWYYVNLAATTGVALTMLVTVCFLSPTFGENWMELFAESNFLLHLLNPLLAVLLFIFTEDAAKKCFPTTFFGLVPMAMYAVYYFWNVFSSAVDGYVSKKVDWYGFLITGNISGTPLVILAVGSVTWLITLALWGLQQKCAGKRSTGRGN